LLSAPESFFIHRHIVLYFGVEMAYIKFYIFCGGSENYSLAEFSETLTMISVIMNIPGAVVGWLAVIISKNKISISKVI